MTQEQDVNYQNSHWARRRRVIWFWKWHPFAATCSHSSGRKWPLDILPRKLFHIFRGHLQPLQWPPAATSIWFFIGSHLQPLEWPPVAARILFSSATTCSHLQPIEWPQVAARASGRKCKWPPEQVAASGRKWPPLPKSNSCPSARSLKIPTLMELQTDLECPQGDMISKFPPHKTWKWHVPSTRARRCQNVHPHGTSNWLGTSTRLRWCQNSHPHGSPWNFKLTWSVHTVKIFPPPSNCKLTWIAHKVKTISKFPPPWNFRVSQYQFHNLTPEFHNPPLELHNPTL